jgi:hypothetical protein
VNAQAAGVHAALREFKSGTTKQLNEQQVVTTGIFFVSVRVILFEAAAAR